MMKLFIGVALMLLINVNAVGSCSATCPGCSLYIRWNQEIINNGGNACSSFSLSTPANFTKNKGQTGGTILRKFLSHYTHSSHPSCKVFCPPGSYLTTYKNLYVCQRDPAYYPSSPTYCVPQF